MMYSQLMISFPGMDSGLIKPFEGKTLIMDDIYGSILSSSFYTTWSAENLECKID